MNGHIASFQTSFIDIPSQIAYDIYFTGCPIKCKGCQNPELQDINIGKIYTIDDAINEINKNKLVKWVCLLGGEPLFQPEFVYELCKKLEHNIGIYSGYDFDIIKVKYSNIINLPNVKYIVAGQYIQELEVMDRYPLTLNKKIYYKKDNEWLYFDIDKLGKDSLYKMIQIL